MCARVKAPRSALNILMRSPGGPFGSCICVPARIYRRRGWQIPRVLDWWHGEELTGWVERRQMAEGGPPGPERDAGARR